MAALGPGWDQALEDEFAALIGDESQIAEVDNPAWCEVLDEPKIARRISEVAHHAECKDRLWRKSAGVDRCHQIQRFA